MSDPAPAEYYDHAGFWETYSGVGCFVTHRDGRAWGPYATERQTTNARLRLRRGAGNARDQRLALPCLPWKNAE